jgi:protein-tyrosine phosphatase
MLASSFRVFVLALGTASCASESPLSAPTETRRPGSARAIARPVIADSKGSVGGDGAEQPSGSGGATDPSAGLGSGAGASAEPAESLDCEPHQPVLTQVVTNARDLGGTPLADGGAVRCGGLYRGQPLSLSNDGCAEAARLRMRTVLDLRTESERTSLPDAGCVDANLVWAPLPVPYGLAAADYLNVLHETPSIAVAFHTFGDATAYPIYFHCTLGRDRTGVVSALLLLALGASRQTVMQEYLLSEPNVGAYPESLNAVLDEVELRGGVENVLHDAGISDAELAVMREKATASGAERRDASP